MDDIKHTFKITTQICLVAKWCTAGLHSFYAFTSDKAPLLSVI